MIIIADSGSTKTDWVLMEDRKEIFSCKTIGMNPYFTTTEKVIATLEQEMLPFINKDKVKEIHFYGSGCSFPEKKAVIGNGLKALFEGVEIEIQHDLLGAARALFGNEKGITGILGTGSNSCVYDGNDVVENIFSLGYMFGDEGSGAYLGKKYITAHLKKKVPPELYKAFYESCNYSNEDILTNVYKKPNPNRFLASFAVFLKQHIDHAFVAKMVEESFVDFFREQVICYKSYKELPFSFVGSLGCNFVQQVRNAAARFDIALEKYMVSPMEGLIHFHSKQE
jgi:glucosamine kinase